MQHSLQLDGYNPDASRVQAEAFCIRVDQRQEEIPFHQHRKGQLILALNGGVTCEVEQAMWMVPPQYAVWIPGKMPHSNRATAMARLCFLFIEPGSVAMPQQCCTLKITSLVRELILRLADYKPAQINSEPGQRLVQVLFDELPRQPQERLQLPVSGHPKLREMVSFMEVNPGSRRTLAQWAAILAMSERNLARLVVRETGLSYRRWRQQFQIIQALRLLITGQKVQHVAQMLGYDSTTAFITMFKKMLGMTPGRYLESLAETSFPE